MQPTAEPLPLDPADEHSLAREAEANVGPVDLQPLQREPEGVGALEQDAAAVGTEAQVRDILHDLPLHPHRPAARDIVRPGLPREGARDPDCQGEEARRTADHPSPAPCGRRSTTVGLSAAPS